ncbi:MAG: transposase [Acidobacteria bacterium]|nr:transposase [Acidobacteriota bacterium]MBA3885401.1 transposase [Acidobacteriota bacterium]
MAQTDTLQDRRRPLGEATFHTLETRDITAYISLGHEGKPDTTPNPAHEATRRLAARLASEGGRARYRRRKAIVEPVIGWIKAVLGFRYLSLRGEVNSPW